MKFTTEQILHAGIEGMYHRPSDIDISPILSYMTGDKIDSRDSQIAAIAKCRLCLLKQFDWLRRLQADFENANLDSKEQLILDIAISSLFGDTHEVKPLT